MGLLLKENKMMEPSERLRLCSMLTFFCEHYSLEEKGSSQEDANVSKSSVLEESRATVLRKINFKVQELLYKLRTNTLAEDDYIHVGEKSPCMSLSYANSLSLDIRCTSESIFPGHPTRSFYTPHEVFCIPKVWQR
jgi:hypothetical protein